MGIVRNSLRKSTEDLTKINDICIYISVYLYDQTD